MSTTKVQTNQYNQQGTTNYNAWQKALNPIMLGYAQNPFSNPFFSQNLSQNMANSNRSGMGAIQNAMSQFNMTGFGGAPSGARSQLTSQLNRFGSGLNANAFYNASNNAFANQWKSLGTMAGFQPLQTGSKQTTSGLGTWLPQLVAAGLGGAQAASSMGAGASLAATPQSIGPQMGGMDPTAGNALAQATMPNFQPFPSMSGGSNMPNFIF